MCAIHEDGGEDKEIKTINRVENKKNILQGDGNLFVRTVGH